MCISLQFSLFSFELSGRTLIATVTLSDMVFVKNYAVVGLNTFLRSLIFNAIHIALHLSNNVIMFLFKTISIQWPARQMQRVKTKIFSLDYFSTGTHIQPRTHPK